MVTFVRFINADSGATIAVNPHHVELVEDHGPNTDLWLIDVPEAITVTDDFDDVLFRLTNG